MLDREADGCDSLEGFQLIHSLAGGTGSGVGSFLLELLSDHYSKKLTKTISIFPMMGENADVVVQPYNAILTLKRLSLEADACVILDNTSLNKIASDKLKLPNVSISETNRIVTQAMSAMSAGMRFPSVMMSDMTSLIASLVPVPMCHFLSCGFSPLTAIGQNVNPIVRKTTVTDIMRNLLQDGNIMVSSSIREGAFLSCMNILRGQNIQAKDINKAITNIHERKMVKFVPWAPALIDVMVTRQSMFTPNSHKFSGLMMANHTGIRNVRKRKGSRFLATRDE